MPPSRGLAAAAVLVLGWAPALAADSGAATGTADGEASAAGSARVFDHLLVTGGPERVDSTPGSAHLLTRGDLAAQEYADIHRLLRQVPGVNLQEEEGYGLRPNIGMRGSGVDRSSKITLLEDGVLIAPAPYAAPAAYYFPTPGRMEAVEVRKGSSAVRQGPFTLGGVLNLVSTTIPPRRAGRARLSFDDRGGGRLHAHAGGSGSRFGWLVETYQLQTDGFKRLDNGGPTGVELGDWVGKLRVAGRPGARSHQVAELKLGRTDQRAQETYLGLTLDDFLRTPYRRYAASAADLLDSEHEQIQLRYLAQLGGSVDLTATLYRNRFGRNWHKLQSVGGVGIRDVLLEPERFAARLAVLRGERDELDGGLAVRNNRRSYRSQGLELVLGFGLETGRAAHRLELGLRRHQDEEDRLQEDDLWNLIGGEMRRLALGPPGSQSNRLTEARVWALYLQDEIRVGRLSLTPGVRFESIEFRRRDYARDDPGRGAAALSAHASDVEVLIPGLGATYRLGDRWYLVAGVYRGFAPPGPGSDGRTRAEESLNYEAGFRLRSGELRAELVGFVADYDNLLGRDTLSAGGSGSGELFNGGAALVRGVEASLQRSFRAAGATLPLRVSYTRTEGEFRSSFESDFTDWSPRVETGDELPYLPRHQGSLLAGWQRGEWGLHLSLAYGSAMRTAPGRGALRADQSTDSYLIADLSLERRLGERWALFGRVRNLTDEVYRAALRPAGARPGLPRTVLAGGSWRF